MRWKVIVWTNLWQVEWECGKKSLRQMFPQGVPDAEDSWGFDVQKVRMRQTLLQSTGIPRLTLLHSLQTLANTQPTQAYSSQHCRKTSRSSSAGSFLTGARNPLIVEIRDSMRYFSRANSAMRASDCEMNLLIAFCSSDIWLATAERLDKESERAKRASPRPQAGGRPVNAGKDAMGGQERSQGALIRCLHGFRNIWLSSTPFHRSINLWLSPFVAVCRRPPLGYPIWKLITSVGRSKWKLLRAAERTFWRTWIYSRRV